MHEGQVDSANSILQASNWNVLYLFFYLKIS